MATTSYLFGFQEQDIDEVCKRVEQALGIRMEARESFFHGGDYCRYSGEGHGELILQMNRDLVDDTLAEPDFPDVTMLLYVDGTLWGAEIEKALAKHIPDMRLLSREQEDNEPT